MSTKLPKISLITLSYNSREKLPLLLASLRQQTFQDFELVVVDNASVDDSVTWIRQQQIFPVTTVLENQTNLWYAKGNNQAWLHCRGEFIIFCNDDVRLSPNCLAELVHGIEQDDRIAIVGGKLLRPVVAGAQPIIDSAGLTIRRNRQVTNRGENQIDTGQYNTAGDVFGISGALLCARRSALEDTQQSGAVFDVDFVAYKEDVDLSWRIHRAGWRVCYLPKAVAYHGRTIQASQLRNRKNKSKLIRAMSYRNHWWTVIKNDDQVSFWRDAIWIIPYECAKLLYLCLAEWSTLAVIPELIRGIPVMRRRRIPGRGDPIHLWIKT
ncbi:MAG: glycosyltransferase family 2 protein [Candidatus Kerfeldbacteria bacterium]|nr:glycosyltransferase family 2 protein [Candidatus Kerfeldbacteria bacterium]